MTLDSDRTAAPVPEPLNATGRAAWHRSGVIVVLLLAAAPRFWAAWLDHGVVWPDEIFQTLEPAHHALFGYGMEAWEFAAGARSWLLPGFVVVVWWLLSLLGVDSALGLVGGIKLMMATLSLLGVHGAMRLAETIGGRTAALAAGLLAAVFPLSLVFGSRCMGDGVSGTILVFALLLVMRPGLSRPLLSGALCGLAVFLKYQNGIVLLGILGFLLVARRGADVRLWLLGALLVGLLGGLLDWPTWGSPFHAFRTYLEYNVLYDRSSQYGVASPGAYLEWAWDSTGPALAAIALGLVVAWRRAAIPIAIGMTFVLLHVAVPHKELRFLLPVVPLLLAAAGAGLAAALERMRASAPVALALATVLAASMAHHAVNATYGSVGAHAKYPAGRLPVWHALEGVNQLMALVGRQPDACGLWIAGIRVPFAGGYTYLHRDVPLLWAAAPYNVLFANYLLMPVTPLPFPLGADDVDALAEPPGGYRAVARSRGWELYARSGGCEDLPALLDLRRML